LCVCAPQLWRRRRVEHAGTRWIRIFKLNRCYTDPAAAVERWWQGRTKFTRKSFCRRTRDDRIINNYLILYACQPRWSWIDYAGVQILQNIIGTIICYIGTYMDISILVFRCWEKKTHIIITCPVKLAFCNCLHLLLKYFYFDLVIELPRARCRIIGVN